MIYSSADPLPSSPAQEALDLLFNCGSTEEASSSPARGPLTEAELALFDPFSKEGNSWDNQREGWAEGAQRKGGRQCHQVGCGARLSLRKVPSVGKWQPPGELEAGPIALCQGVASWMPLYSEQPWRNEISHFPGGIFSLQGPSCFRLVQGLAGDPEVRRGLLVKAGEAWAQGAAGEGPGEAVGLWGHQDGRGPHGDPGPELLALRSGTYSPGLCDPGSLHGEFSAFMLLLQLLG